MDDFLVSSTDSRSPDGPGRRGALLRLRAALDSTRLPALFWLVGAPTRFAVTAVLAAIVTVVGTFFYGDRGTLAAEVAAAVISVNFAAAFARRIGGRSWAGALLAVLVSGLAIATGVPFLLASAAVGTAGIAAVLGVIATRPAATLVGLFREIVIATGIALVGGLAATAYRAPLSAYRARYLVIALALMLTLVLVHRLGSGLSGLGSRGWASLGGGAVALLVIVVYTEAFTRWESEATRTSIEHLLGYLDQTMGAAPRPLIFMVGVPALLWGVSARMRRREGWWLTSFGSVGLAIISTMFLVDGHPTVGPVLSLGYSIALGLVVGGVLVAADQRLSRPAGRRVSHSAVVGEPNVEPARHEPLL